MVELGIHASASKRRFTFGWVEMVIVMSFAVAAIDFSKLPLQTVYVFVVGATLREAIGLAVWTLRR